MIVQNISQDGITINITAVPDAEMLSAKEILKDNIEKIKYDFLNKIKKFQNFSNWYGNDVSIGCSTKNV